MLEQIKIKRIICGRGPPLKDRAAGPAAARCIWDPPTDQRPAGGPGADGAGVVQ